MTTPRDQSVDSRSTQPVDQDVPGRGPAPKHALQQRHIVMIALGGVLGSGLFVGSGAGLRLAGPGIILSYTVAGILFLLVMRMLGEMAAAYPTGGSFSVHATRAHGRSVGTTLGWMYWLLLVVAIAVEAGIAATLLHGWLSWLPQWAGVLVLMTVFTAVNLAAVGVFGELEFWFAALKVAVVLAFIGLGALSMCGVLPGSPATVTAHLTGHGGFLPNGLAGVAAGLLAVMFSFGGSEAVTIAAAETADPVRAIRSAVRTVVWRLLGFYLGSILVMILLLPCDSVPAGHSPYVAVLDVIGFPGAAFFMEAVVFVAVLSALNANLYSASRMIRSLAERGEAPGALTRTTRQGVPALAVVASASFGFIAVALNFLWPTTVFTVLLNSVGAVMLLVWFAVAATHLRLRRHLEKHEPERLVLRTPGFPYLTWVALLVIGVLFVLMLTTSEARLQLLGTALTTGIVLCVVTVTGKGRTS
ncbi:amino acid permease [Streptomyces sp. NPDC088745]|uniref:amino acid permease n=1 Tax=Streptomyces sp. NPDC088745 TaxID=3365884 RepID=UPI00380A1E89